MKSETTIIILLDEVKTEISLKTVSDEVGGIGSVALEWEWMRLSIEWRSSNTISDIHSIHLIHCPSIQAQQGQLTTCKVTTSNEYKEDIINHADCIYTYIHHLSTSLGGGGIFALLEESKIANF